MNNHKEYFAFISYQRQDEEWAKWLAHELENYQFPTTLNGRTDIPDNLRPIFRDIDELSAGNLPAQIHRALSRSKHLIVICSPRSAKSVWVNKEIETFISFGKTANIFPFIVEGKAYSNNPDEECFPPALKNVPKDEERLGGNINEMGRDAAVVKTIAGMLDLDFDILWQRYERQKAEEERKIREQRERLLKIQSRYLAEKSLSIASSDSYTARLFAVEALPQNLKSPDRPYVAEAEAALRKACSSPNCLIRYDANYVSFSPDGYKIVTASDDCTVRIWNTLDGTEIKRFVGHKERVLVALYTPDAKNIISTSRDGTIIIWDIESEKAKYVLIDHKTRENCYVEIQGVRHVPWAKSLSISKDGKMLASVDRLSKNMCLWSIGDGKLLKRYVFTETAEIVRFNPSGDCIAVVCSPFGKKDNIYIVNISTGKLIKRICGKSAVMRTIEFSPDGKRIIGDYSSDTEKASNSIIVWDVQSGEIVDEIDNLSGSLSTIQYSPDGNFIIASPTDRINSNTFDFNIKIYDTHTNELKDELKGHSDNVLSTSISNNNCKVVSCSKDGTIRIWELAKSEVKVLNLVEMFFNKLVVNSICYSPDQHFIAYGDSNGTVSIWDTKKRVKIKSLLLQEGEISCVVFSRDGQIIAASTLDYNIYLWDTSSFNLLHVLKGHTNDINTISFNQDGTRLVTASSDGTIKIWDTNVGKELMSFEAAEQEDEVTNAWYSPDDQHIASTEEESYFLIWDANTGELLHRIETLDLCDCISYSSDGMYIATGSGNTIEIWDAKTLMLIKSIKTDGREIERIVYSPDNKYIATVSPFDDSIKIWEVASGVMMQSYSSQTPTMMYNTFGFSPDGTKVVFGGSSGACIGSFPALQSLITQTRNRFRNYIIPEEEREKYLL